MNNNMNIVLATKFIKMMRPLNEMSHNLLTKYLSFSNGLPPPALFSGTLKPLVF